MLEIFFHPFTVHLQAEIVFCDFLEKTKIFEQVKYTMIHRTYRDIKNLQI